MADIIFAFSLLGAVCAALIFALAHFFAIVTALGVNKRSGIISIFVPLFAFYVCYTGGKNASFPIKMGGASLAAFCILLIPISASQH